jgi:hypothetical protein
MEVAMVINVAARPHTCSRGPLGTYTVPGMTDGEFGLLVVRPEAEIQDIGGGQTRRGDRIPSRKLAADIIGAEGEKRGMHICSAEPDVPASLERAENEERAFLASNPGELSNRLNQISKMREFKTVRDPDERKQMEKLSARVQEEREKFDAACRKMVQPKEVLATQGRLTAYYQSLVKEADRLWAREATKSEVNEHHKEAAIALGYEPPWNYTPGVSEDCPACGQKVKKGVAICAHCNAILDDKKAREFKVGPYAQQAQPAMAGAK